MLLGFVICGSCWITAQKEGRSQRKKKNPARRSVFFTETGSAGSVVLSFVPWESEKCFCPRETLFAALNFL